jgi:hypothetical protein
MFDQLIIALPPPVLPPASYLWPSYSAGEAWLTVGTRHAAARGKYSPFPVKVKLDK